jgi:hypothetical protein
VATLVKLPLLPPPPPLQLAPQVVPLPWTGKERLSTTATWFVFLTAWLAAAFLTSCLSFSFRSSHFV